jgi:hypothetical protein
LQQLANPSLARRFYPWTVHILKETGINAQWSTETFGDFDGVVRQSIARIKSSPFTCTPAG